MAKINIRQQDPIRYAKVKAEQDELNKQCSAQMTLARFCPYCNHRITILFRGQHGFAREKCPNCGEEVIFPPVSFRMAN